MSVDLEPAIDEVPDEFLQYRALSSLAVISLIVGLLSVLTLFDWFWLVLPVCGILLGVCAWRNVKSRPTELTGLALAKLAVALSVLFLFAGPSWLTYEFLHEVPEGSEPISYSTLQPDVTVPGEKIPPAALALDGKRVFIKGFVYPGGKQKEGIKTFVLVRDRGDCCFGGNPKITDRIQVTLNDPLRLRMEDLRLHGVAGVFHVKPSGAVGGIGGVFYHLEADYLH
jgi:hypothetical protein